MSHDENARIAARQAARIAARQAARTAATTHEEARSPVMRVPSVAFSNAPPSATTSTAKPCSVSTSSFSPAAATTTLIESASSPAILRDEAAALPSLPPSPVRIGAGRPGGWLGPEAPLRHTNREGSPMSINGAPPPTLYSRASALTGPGRQSAGARTAPSRGPGGVRIKLATRLAPLTPLETVRAQSSGLVRRLEPSLIHVRVSQQL